MPELLLIPFQNRIRLFSCGRVDASHQLLSQQAASREPLIKLSGVLRQEVTVGHEKNAIWEVFLMEKIFTDPGLT